MRFLFSPLLGSCSANHCSYRGILDKTNKNRAAQLNSLCTFCNWDLSIKTNNVRRVRSQETTSWTTTTVYNFLDSLNIWENVSTELKNIKKMDSSQSEHRLWSKSVAHLFIMLHQVLPFGLWSTIKFYSVFQRKGTAYHWHCSWPLQHNEGAWTPPDSSPCGFFHLPTCDWNTNTVGDEQKDPGLLI